MKYSKSTLKNGLKVLTVPRKDTSAVMTMVLFRAGTRSEVKSQNGIAHFLEHMMFKGCSKYPSYKDIPMTVDGIGGEFNAFTWREFVGYYIRADQKHTDLIFDILSDMTLHPLLPKSELEKERGVILEEINMYEDNPRSKISRVFGQMVLGDQPMGWETLGEKKIIKTLQRSDFVKFWKKYYRPDNGLVISVGKIKHPDHISLVRKHFKFPISAKTPKVPKFISPTSKSRVALVTQSTEQAHFLLGCESFSRDDHKLAAFTVMNRILGGMMSSRLFTHIRDEQGLAYYVHSGNQAHSDVGMFTISAGVTLSKIEEAITGVIAEVRRMQDEPVSPEELRRGQENVLGKFTLALEDSDFVADVVGFDELLLGKVRDPKAYMKQIRAVTATDVQRMAREVIDLSKLKLAIIGPYRSKKVFEKLLP